MPRIDIARKFDWDTFVSRYWNRRPVLYRGTSASPFRAEDVFDAATGATRHYLRREVSLDSRPAVQFTLGRKQQLGLEPWLPREEDGSLEGYDTRLVPRLKDQRYALIIARLHASGFGLWSRERAFFSELWRRVGLPLSGGITTLFHGNYEHSPVGVHQDRFTTFLFALRGRKRMRFWPKKPWSAPVSTILDYAPYLEDSFVAEVGPGDILYWPASYYHVGESAGPEVATSVNVGIPLHEHLLSYDLQDLLPDAGGEGADEVPERHVSRRTGVSPLARGVLSASGVLSPVLPPALQEAAGALRRRSRKQEVEERLQRVWLQRLSAAGFEPVPPPVRGGRLTDEASVRADPRFPILVEPRGTGQWLCAANGHVLTGEGRVEPVARMMDTLNTGDAVRVGSLLRPFRSRDTRERMRRVLERLRGFRALTPRRSAPWD